MRASHVSLIVLSVLGLAGVGVPAHSGTIEDIQARGIVTCAVPAQEPGIAVTAEGKRSGLAIDLCGVLAAAVLGRPAATAFVEVTVEDAALVLQAEDADVLFLPQPWRLSQEAEEGMLLVQPLLQGADGRTFGPVVRQGDDGWFAAVRWLLAGLVTGPRKIPEAARDSAVSGLGLAPRWREDIASVSESYDALLARHMKPLEEAGWSVLPVPVGPRF